MWPFVSKQKTYPEPTREQLENLRYFIERMVELEKDLPLIRARQAAERAVDNVWERFAP